MTNDINRKYQAHRFDAIIRALLCLLVLNLINCRQSGQETLHAIDLSPLLVNQEVQSLGALQPADAHPGILMRLDPQRLSQLSLLQKVELRNFPLPSLGDVMLRLERQALPIAADSKNTQTKVKLV